MKKLLLSAFAVASFSANAQVTVFEDGFETYDDFLITGFGDWLTIDIDGLGTYTGGLDEGAEPWPNSFEPQAWIIFNPVTAMVSNATSGAEVRNFDPHTGSKYAASWASVPDAGVGNNDLLVSPMVSLGTSNNEVKFWVKSMSNSYGLEQYRVLVTTNPNPTQLSDFTQISGVPALQAPYPNWEEKTFSLNAYSNQSIRVAIRNVGVDHYMLMVDDFRILSSNLAANEAFSSKFSTYPNPATNVINLTNAESIRVNAVNITDLNGRIVKSVKFTDAPADIQINIADLSSGMYMMNISSDQGTAVKKIVKN